MDRALGKEIAAGYVVHLDPDELLARGATHTVDEATRVQGQHFFLCLGLTDGHCRLIPLFSNANPGRVRLSTEGRSGHDKWVYGTFYFYPNQVWSASPSAVVSAAARAHDKSKPGSRNLLAHAHLPEA